VSASSRGEQVLAALALVPGGAELLEVAGARDDVALVGGAVRDLLLGRAPRELDVVLAGDAAQLAAELAARLGASVERSDSQPLPSQTLHERFGTAVVRWAQGRIDIARAREESYPAPGALPEVRPAGTEQDLARRDFTVNAIAVPLGGRQAGSLQAVSGALEDLAAGRLRVLHERSFHDDPTRLLRLARYRARLGFEVEPHTAELAAEALAAGALATVSGARVGAELRLALGEADPLAALQALSELGVLAALDPPLALDAGLARAALALLPPDGRAEVLLMAVALVGLRTAAGESIEPAIRELLERLEFPAAERDGTLRSVLAAGELASAMALATRPSELHRLLCTQPPEAVALAGALGGNGPPAQRERATQAAQRWLGSLRHVRLAISGDDLLQAGVPQGPEIGRRLDVVLALRLDGELPDGAQAELSAALETRA